MQADPVSRVNLALPVGTISIDDQRVMAADARKIVEDAPLVRPWTPSGHDMKVRVSGAGSLAWTGMGGYGYSERQRDGRPWPKLPGRWVELADHFAGGEFPWDSAIINYYAQGAMLGRHRDMNEDDLSYPIVTFSIGDACSWAVWEGPKAWRTRLESGSVTLLSGRSRNLEHAVERVIPTPMFSPLQAPGRLSVTMRVAGPQSSSRNGL